jgi:hypothetical protein
MSRVDLTPYLRALEQSLTEAAQKKVLAEQPLIPASFPLERRWYVIYTNIKCEFRANMGLKAKGFETFLPYIRKRIGMAGTLTLSIVLFSRAICSSNSTWKRTSGFIRSNRRMASRT